MVPSARAFAGPLAVAAAIALALAPCAALAGDANSRPYLVGDRAAGMGGAFTALADDGAGPWYNPAGLGFVRRTTLSLSGSAYGLVRGTFQDALGDGRSFTYRNLNTAPTATTGVWVLPGASAEEAHVVGAGVYTPDAVNADDRNRLLSPENAFFFTDQEETLWFNATYAWRRGSLSVGAGLFALVRTRLESNDLTLVAPGDPTTFAVLTQRVDSTSYGAVASLGVRWDGPGGLRLGAAAFSPAVGAGERHVYVRAAAAAPAQGTPGLVQVLDVSGLHATPADPLRLQAGAAWTAGQLTLALDASWQAPRTVVDDGHRTDGTIRKVVRAAVADAALGAEWVVEGRFPLRAGLFTDRSASTGRPGLANTARIDRYGVSASAGLLTDHTATSVGVNASTGRGHDAVPDNLDFSRFKVTRATQTFLYVFVASSYAF